MNTIEHDIVRLGIKQVIREATEDLMKACSYDMSCAKLADIEAYAYALARITSAARKMLKEYEEK